MSQDHPLHRWTICYTSLPNTSDMMGVLLADELFGTDMDSKWHLSRGIKRMLRSGRTRWTWFHHYEALIGFATNDPEIEQRFLACCAKANAGQ